MPRQWATYTENIFVGDIAADSSALLYALWKAPNAVRIVAIRLGTKASVAAADTNYNTFSVKDGSVVLATLANGPAAGGISFVLGTFVAMTLGAVLDVASGDTLSLAIAKTGTGLAVTGMVVQLELMDTNP